MYSIIANNLRYNELSNIWFDSQTYQDFAIILFYGVEVYYIVWSATMIDNKVFKHNFFIN